MNNLNLFEKLNITNFDDCTPSKDDFIFVLESKKFYEDTMQDRASDPEKYKHGKYWKPMPWAIAYKIRLSNDQSKLIKMLICAIVADWGELIFQLKRTYKVLRLVDKDWPVILRNLSTQQHQKIADVYNEALKEFNVNNTPVNSTSTVSGDGAAKKASTGLDIRNGLLYGIGTCIDKNIIIPDGIITIINQAFSGCIGLTSITIPDSVTSIGYRAFYGCSRLTSITIGNGVTGIGYEAFSGCSSLTSITIPDSYGTTIGANAFSGCSGLTSITIGNGVTSIGTYAFENCSNLTNINMPNSVVSIGEYALHDCNKLLMITFAGTAEQWNKIKKYPDWKDGSLILTIKCTDKSITEALNLREKIEKHNTLNPKLWNENNTLKSEVTDKIMEIVNDFTDQLKDNEIKFNLIDVKLVGSNCSYNYTNDSDLDVHLVMDTGSLECPDNLYPLLYSAYRTIYNKNHDIDFYGIPVEIFVETSDTKQMTEDRKQTALRSNGIYSVMNNEWIKEPVAEDIPELDQEAFDKAMVEWTNKLDEATKSNDADTINKFIEDLYEYRKDSIANDGEYSVGNYVFKELRNTGKLDAIKDLKGELANKQLSLESLEETVNDRLTVKARERIRIELARVAHNQPIIQDTGRFNIYLVKESDLNSVVNNIRRLPYVENVTSTASGKYDFSRVSFNGTPARYFTISGTIDISKL